MDRTKEEKKELKKENKKRKKKRELEAEEFLSKEPTSGVDLIPGQEDDIDTHTFTSELIRDNIMKKLFPKKQNNEEASSVPSSDSSVPIDNPTQSTAIEPVHDRGSYATDSRPPRGRKSPARSKIPNVSHGNSRKSEQFGVARTESSQDSRRPVSSAAQHRSASNQSPPSVSPPVNIKYMSSNENSFNNNSSNFIHDNNQFRSSSTSSTSTTHSRQNSRPVDPADSRELTKYPESLSATQKNSPEKRPSFGSQPAPSGHHPPSSNWQVPSSFNNQSRNVKNSQNTSGKATLTNWSHNLGGRSNTQTKSSLSKNKHCSSYPDYDRAPDADAIYKGHSQPMHNNRAPDADAIYKGHSQPMHNNRAPDADAIYKGHSQQMYNNHEPVAHANYEHSIQPVHNNRAPDAQMPIRQSPQSNLTLTTDERQQLKKLADSGNKSAEQLLKYQHIQDNINIRNMALELLTRQLQSRSETPTNTPIMGSSRTPISSSHDPNVQTVLPGAVKHRRRGGFNH